MESESALRLESDVSGSGEPLLLIHGIIGDRTFFKGFAESLRDSFSVISYDRRGYGDSPAPEDGDYSVAAQAEDAFRVLSEHTKAPAWIFGNSAGSLIALELYLRHPDRVKGIFLLEPMLAFDAESKAARREWNEELNSYVREKRLKKALPALSRVIGTSDSSGIKSMEEMKRIFSNLSCFMLGELNEVQSYDPDPESLKNPAVPAAIILTEQGRHRLFGRCAEKGAEALGWPVEIFPGSHHAVRENPSLCAELFRRLTDAGRITDKRE